MLKYVMAEYSERLGEITNKQFQQALDRFSLGKLIKAEAVPFGNFGQNVFLTTNKGEFVFRGKPHYPWQFKSEQFMASLLHERIKVPVPHPYLIDQQKDIFGWSYVLMPRLKGKLIKDIKVKAILTRQDRLEIAQVMGENLAKLQKLTWDYPGEYDLKLNGIKPLELPYDQWVISKINEQKNKVSKADWEWIAQTIDEDRDALKVSFTPTFVMHDYQESNVLVDRIDGQWQVTGVFDLMENYFGDGEADLVRLFADYHGEDSQLAYAFLNGYLAKKSVRPGFTKRWPIYMIWDRLVVWSWAKGNKKIWWDANLTFKDWCEKFTNLDGLKTAGLGEQNLG